jgi:hypothetical protein
MLFPSWFDIGLDIAELSLPMVVIGLPGETGVSNGQKRTGRLRPPLSLRRCVNTQK